MVETKRIYLFEEGNKDMKDLLGGKGANLAEMTNIGLPVPPGFTITTRVCNEYIAQGGLPAGLMDDVKEHVAVIEKKMDKKFGDPSNPLLFSVRSGAKFSMPGMMNTILNLGLNDETIKGLVELSRDERFAYDCYRRFIDMFGDVVLGIEHKHFEDIIKEYKKKYGFTSDTELKAEHWKSIVEDFKILVRKEKGEDFPSDPWKQLELAICAVFNSWNGHKAITYRNEFKIPHDLGTAVNVQTMVFGNFFGESGSGVAFTRDPSSGEKVIYGEFLENAQGEDVVAGIRTPKAISQMKDDVPHLYNEFSRICSLLEKHYRDVQDLEFTFEKGKLYMLQARAGKRTTQAAVKIAYDMVEEGLITKEEAIMRIDPNQINQLLHPRIASESRKKAEREGLLLAEGLPASPGAATGAVVFSADLARELGDKGERVLLVRPVTNPDDVHGMIAAKGVLTSEGGMTSHAAVVARQMGKPCVAGCTAIHIDLSKKQFEIGDRIVKEGEVITIDGAFFKEGKTVGQVFYGKLDTEPPELSHEAKAILNWADEIKGLGVHANADTPEDAAKARDFGAKGIGLCRTEHMFMAQERLPIVQEMVIADTPEAREKALAKLLPMQRKDFYGILKAMESYPVTIRLLDPPLHEFLPALEDLLEEVITLKVTGKDPALLVEKEKILRRVREIHESNPMLGLRVCRLGIVYPEIYEMQVRAIFEAACDLIAERVNAVVEVMIPGVGHVEEMKFTHKSAKAVAEEVMKEKGVKVNYKIGTMVELPRACTVADQLAEYAEFFSFGTNDLTQTTYGYSRDDAERAFIPEYIKKGVLKVNPFEVLDREGVGKLMKMAIELGKGTRPDLKIGICGEHGGEPDSVEFCHLVGLTYVSCSPYRVPIARLAAAQAMIKNK
ncbi:MAG TPA: pyruvate, phosphate dikinase [Candidatus Eremiobacteraeota bacterium]|nr:MAG: Pyruvate, phosphate dikinase [bacterium ADurb.Bin363]HPZ08853.1 pyruvate, phosphate dikinase [Candidatus Eremiobacteraeota bacterium]